MKKITLCLAATWLFGNLALAAPGAHGPNGEHLDAPGSTNSAVDSTPRTETFTENFELVAKLYDTELSVLVDEYNTNAPVLNATLMLEVGDLTSTATLHEDAGDYAFDDPTLVKLLQEPGQYELIFTLTTPTQSDLLLATLNSSSAAANNSDHDHHGHLDELLHSPLAWLVAALALGVLIAVAVRIRRTDSNKFSKKI